MRRRRRSLGKLAKARVFFSLLLLLLLLLLQREGGLREGVWRFLCALGGMQKVQKRGLRAA